MQMADEKDMSDLVEEYIDANRLYSFEGDSGLAKLEKLLGALGYSGHNFRYGSPIESFLSDNSGAVEALVDWVRDQNNTEWKRSLEAALPEEDDTDDESEEGNNTEYEDL
jgi:hypothetical protein